MTYKGKKGVDVSSNNDNIDFEKIKKAGFDFVMIRCGFGSDIERQDDTQFEANVKKAEKAKIPWGAYLYSYACDDQAARSEVKHIARLLKGKKPLFPVALDIEDSYGYHERHGAWNKKTIDSVAKIFINGMKELNYYPMLYVGFEEVTNLINRETLKGVDIWWAQWWKVCEIPDYLTLGMWQYGAEVNYLESNSIDGVGVIDKNFSYKDYPSIIKNGGFNGWDKPEQKTLDKFGFTKGNASDGILALKALLIAAKQKGVISQGVDMNNIFGDGTEKAVNQFLIANGYKPTGVAGQNFIKLLCDQLKI